MQVFDTLSETINDLKEKGFTHDFALEYNDIIAEGGDRYTPSQFNVVGVHRFEGMSSSDDNEVLYAVETIDGAKGFILDAYGVYGGTHICPDLLKKLKEHY